MQDRKLIIIGLILAAGLGGYLWKYGPTQKETLKDKKSQPAAVSQVLDTSTQQKEQGIIEGEPFIGNPQAPVTIIEYFSYFCGHCVHFHHQTFPLILKDYIKDGKVKFIPRLYFPPYELGEAVLCANAQGKFYEYHQYLFEHRQDLFSRGQEFKSREEFIEELIKGLKRFAVKLELDETKFNQCLDSHQYQNMVKQWIEAGQKAGVQGTPTFFINGQMVVGNQPYQVIKEVIEKALNK